jgi:hypothetical protein
MLGSRTASRARASSFATAVLLVCAPLLPSCTGDGTAGTADLTPPADATPLAGDLGTAAADLAAAADLSSGGDDLRDAGSGGGDLRDAGSGGGDLRDAAAPGSDLTSSAPDLSLLSVAITAPAAAQLFSAPFSVVAVVHGGDATVAVTAQLDGTVVPLALRAGTTDTWQADPLAPSKDGHFTLTVTAQAASGAQAQASVALDYLTAAPTLTVRAPRLDDAAYGPSLHVDATCNSPLSGCTIHTYLNGCSGTSAADGTDTLVADVSTYEVAAGSGTVCLQAVDRAGHTVTTPPLRVHVIIADQANASLYDADQEIFAANFDQPSWQIVRGNRTLPTVYKQNTVIDETQPMTLQLDTVLPPASPQSSVAVDGFVRSRDQVWVAPGGAVLSQQPGGSGSWLYRTLPGDVRATVLAAAPSSLRVSGDWAAFVSGSDLYTLQLSQPDLAAALVHVGSGQSIDIGANGVYAYTTTGSGGCGGALVWNGGAPLALAASDVRTDGSSALFQTYGSGCAPGLARFDGQSVTWTLPQQVDSYAIDNGWAAYTMFSVDSIEVVATLLAPDATIAQVYPTGDPATIEAVAKDGTFTYVSDGVRVWADANDDRWNTQSGDGHVYVTDGGLYITLGRSVFSLQYP